MPQSAPFNNASGYIANTSLPLSVHQLIVAERSLVDFFWSQTIIFLLNIFFKQSQDEEEKEKEKKWRFLITEDLSLIEIMHVSKMIFFLNAKQKSQQKQKKTRLKKIELKLKKWMKMNFRSKFLPQKIIFGFFCCLWERKKNLLGFENDQDNESLKIEMLSCFFPIV